jgi:hypothetical protein
VCCKTKTSQLPVFLFATGDTCEGRSILQTSREQKCIILLFPVEGRKNVKA